MPQTSRWYPQSGGGLIARLWTAQQMGIALLRDTYVPNLDAHLRYSDVSPFEVAAGGTYVLGGKQIANRSATYDALADEYGLFGDDVQWGPGATITARYGVIYEMTTTDKYLWALLDFDQNFVVNNGIFVVDFANGVLAVKGGPAV